MQVRPTLAPSEYKEAAVLIRSKYFWLKFIGANWYASLILIVILFALGNAMLNKGSINYTTVLPLLVFAVGLIAYSWDRYSVNVDRAFEAQNAARTSLALEADGIHLTAKSGTTIFFPWSGYSSWVEGKSVFVLKGDNGALILPRDDISSKDIQTVLAEKIS